MKKSKKSLKRKLEEKDELVMAMGVFVFLLLIIIVAILVNKAELAKANAEIALQCSKCLQTC